jgi:hypothetical protein
MTRRRAITTSVVANLIVIGHAIILGLVRTGNPSRFFGEGRHTTVVSCAQLLAVSFFSTRIFLARRSLASKVGSISSAWVWVFIAAGFVFLAADEALEIHERLDWLIHRTFHMRPTAWTDRLDDAIIAIYGFIGLAILWVFRRELLFFKRILRPLGGGFVCLFASVACDAISNGGRFLIWLFGNGATAKRLHVWFLVGDGAFTLLAEGLFVAAFYLSYRASIESPSRAMQPTALSPHGLCDRPADRPVEAARRPGDS